MIQGMGAIPTPVEITELYTALMSGMVSGQENPLTNIFALKFYEVQKHVIMTGHRITSYNVCYTKLLRVVEVEDAREDLEGESG